MLLSVHLSNVKTMETNKTSFGEWNNVFSSKTKDDRILLSILIPSIPERYDMLNELLRELQDQCDRLPPNLCKKWELCCAIDNGTRSVGAKRNQLLRMAVGRFVTFIDDDDFVEPSYLNSILTVIEKNPSADVVTFKQKCTLNGGRDFFTVDADMTHDQNEIIPEEGPWKTEYKRLCWHWCVFRASMTAQVNFRDISVGEDLCWLSDLYPKIRVQAKINRVLHQYRFSKELTRMQTVSNRSCLDIFHLGKESVLYPDR